MLQKKQMLQGFESGKRAKNNAAEGGVVKRAQVMIENAEVTNIGSTILKRTARDRTSPLRQ